MEKTQIGFDEKATKEIEKILNTILATTYAIYLKTQKSHWNIRSAEFYSYHIMLEKQYEEMADAIDEIAERVRSLGHFPPGSFEAFSKISLVKGEEGVPSAPEMLGKLLSDHETLVQMMRSSLPTVEGLHDGATADLINKRLATHEKVAWMLRSSRD